MSNIPSTLSASLNQRDVISSISRADQFRRLFIVLLLLLNTGSRVWQLENCLVIALRSLQSSVNVSSGKILWSGAYEWYCLECAWWDSKCLGNANVAKRLSLESLLSCLPLWLCLEINSRIESTVHDIFLYYILMWLNSPWPCFMLNVMSVCFYCDAAMLWLTKVLLKHSRYNCSSYASQMCHCVTFFLSWCDNPTNRECFQYFG